MADDVPDAVDDPGWLLEDLAGRVPGIRSAMLVSLDGLAMASHGLSRDSADRLAASACGLFSITRGVAVTSGAGDDVRQVVAEMGKALFFVSAAGSGAALAVIADISADPGVIGYEMTQLAKACGPFLAAARRTRGAVTFPVAVRGEGEQR